MIKQKINSPRSVNINVRNVPSKIKQCDHQYWITSNDTQQDSQSLSSNFIKKNFEFQQCDRNCSGQMSNYKELLTCPTSNCFQLEKELISYLKDYEQIKNGIDLKTFQIQKHPDLCLRGILEMIINQFFEGQDSQVLLHDEITGFDILYGLNKILLNLEEKKQKDLKKKDDDQYKISFINIISDNFQPTEFQIQKFAKNFQSFTLIYPLYQDSQNKIFEQEDKIKDLKYHHQYIAPIIENETVFDPLDFLYKYFIKSKLKEFKPNIIVMAVEINDELRIENQLLEKLVWQLEQQCQKQFILIPYKGNVNQEDFLMEKVIKTSLSLINSLLTQDKQNRKKSKYFNSPSHNYYQVFQKFFQNTKKNERLFKLQSDILKCLNKQVKDVQELDQEKNQEYTINNQLQWSSIALLEESQIQFFDLFQGYDLESFDLSEKKFFINQETKYYVSYKLYDQQLKQTQIILVIIQNEKLFYSIFISQPNVQNKKIFLKQLNTFENLEGSSFLLRQDILYQVQLQTLTSNGIVKGILNKYQFNDNPQKIYSSSFINPNRNVDLINIQEVDFDLIENFSLLYHSDENISVMGGIYKGSIYYHTGFLLRKNQQNNYQLAKFKKHDVNGKFMYKLRGYDNALILNTEINNQFLYFESLNKFQVKSLEPSMFKLNFSLLAEIPSYTFDQSVQIINKEELLNKYLLFRADRFNVKISSEQNHLRYDIIVQEVVKDNFKLKQFSDIKYINQLGKFSVIQVYHFTIKFENLTKLRITQFSQKQLQPEQQVIDVQKSLVQKCLYQNWLEDEKNNKIFHFDNHRNMYLLYYQLFKKHEARKFIFISENQQVENDYQEVILNDLQNENIWIVRKIYLESDSIDLVLYICDWINLLDIKETSNNQISQVKINEVYRIKNYDEDFNLIGLQLQENQNNLILYSTRWILKFPIKIIKEKLWQNVFNYLPNSWIKQKITFEKPIHEQQNLSLKFSSQTPSTIVSDQDSKILIFYTYCNINYLNNNQNQLVYKYFELDQKSMNLQSKLLFKTINITEQIILCKITSVYVENENIVMGVIIQYDSQNFETRILTFNQIEEENQRNQIVKIQNNNYEHLNNISSLKREQKNNVETLLYSQNESKLLPF